MHKLFLFRMLSKAPAAYSDIFNAASLRGGHTQNQHKTKKYYSVCCDNRHAVLLIPPHY